MIQKRTRLFLTQLFTIFYPLKSSKNLFFQKKNLVFHMQFFNPFRISFGLLYLCFFYFNILFSIFLYFFFFLNWDSRLFLTQPLTIFYPLKDSKNLFFQEKKLVFHMQFFNPFRISFGLLYLCFFYFNILFSIFCTFF